MESSKRTRRWNTTVAWTGLVLSFGLAIATKWVLEIDPKLIGVFVFFVFGQAGARWYSSWRNR